MRTLITLLLLIPFLAFCQVPQGVGYQGVATDSLGTELVNQSISIRASILSGSATGNIEWQETHNTSTDTFGLFTLSIGEGTSTGNGSLISFADISWGANTHFLKIEMDVNGGSNYSFMGTNQLMSVPYALYAENANIDYDSISTLLSNDSTFITTVSGGNGGGCDFSFPDGLDGQPILIDLKSSDYTVPAGKNLYIMSAGKDGGGSGTFTINGFIHSDLGMTSFYSQIAKAPLIVKSGDILSFISSFTFNQVNVFGYLVDANITPIVIDLKSSDYTVPAGKNLYIMSAGKDGGGSGTFTIDGFIHSDLGMTSFYNQTVNTPLKINPGVVLSFISSFTFNQVNVFGYLADENYFANCGGGGGGSSSSGGSNNSGGGGCDILFPDGLEGFAVTQEVNLSTAYVVPTGKRLYVVSWRSATPVIDGISVNFVGGSPLILNAGESLTSTASSILWSSFNGFLVDQNIEINSVIQEVNLSTAYVVPTGKRLYVVSWRSATPVIDGISVNFVGGSPLILNEGESLTSTASSILWSSFNGYLADENYFADCGGGGSSSATVDSSYIDSLVQFYSNGNGGGCDFSFPEGLDGQSITSDVPYTVPSGKKLYILGWIGGQPVIDNITMNTGSGTPIVLSPGQSLGGTGSSSAFNGYLVDEISQVNATTSVVPYTVPSGKKLYILGWIGGQPVIDNITMNTGSGTPIVLSPGQSLGGTGSSSAFNGYLVDEDYFAGCGGGGSSSSTIDSSYIDSLVQYYSSGNGVGDGCDIQFPDGISSDIIEGWLYSSTTYTVPAGKTLYITNVSTSPAIDFRVNNKRVFYNNNANEWSNSINVILAPSNSVLSSNATGPNTCTYYGFLVDENVEVVNEFLGGFSSYTVPVGKVFYIANTNIFTNGDIRVNNKRIVYANSGTTFANNSNFISVSSGSIITGNTSSLASATVNGYLVDENYFAGCGGGSSSTTSSSSGIGGGCDLSFPEGIDGEGITEPISTTVSYTVPAGKRLYFLTNDNSSPVINGKDVGRAINNGTHPVILNSGDVLTGFDPTTVYFNGLLIDELSGITAITEPFSTTVSYTVPAGKRLYFLTNDNSSPVINGKDVGRAINNGTHPVILNSGDVLTGSDLTTVYFNGYLADENYFADCGGGGGSSTSTVDSSYIDSLVQYYVSNSTLGGCNIDPFYPDGMEGVGYTNIYITNSTPYTVPANKTFYLYTNIGSSGLTLSGQLGNVISGDHFFPIPVGEGNVININGGSIAGYLIDKKFDVLNYLGGGTNYTVPNDMYLYVLHAPQSILINSSNNAGPTTLYNNNRARTPLVFQPGDIISSSLGISGLLIPIDYCNQTVLTSINSSNSSGSCDFEFPDGLSSTIVSESISSSDTYSVPAGKSLYITQASIGSNGGTNSLKIDGVEIINLYGLGTITEWVSNSGVIIASSGSVISSVSNSLGYCQINGLLVNEGVEVIAEEISNSDTYSVPAGKSLYITQASIGSNGGTNSLKIDGVEIINLYGLGYITEWVSNSGVIIASSGSVISSVSNSLGYCQINGYLVDENYFADCGGGGGSSSSSNNNSGNMIVSDFGDTLTLNGQSIIVPGISYSNYVPSYGSVTDIDGNTYQTTTIYGKEWMIEDLLVTKYSNGDPITLITGVNPWWGSVCSNAGYRTHSNVGSLGPKVWYNIYVVQDSRGICPNGWHIPTEQDYIDILNVFDVMTSTGNGYGSWWENAGPPLKKLTGGWDYTNYPEGQATNQSYLGFESFGPATCTSNSYYGSNTEHRSWTSTPGGPNGGNWSLYLKPQEDQVYFNDASADMMLPCRCVKD